MSARVAELLQQAEGHARAAMRLVEEARLELAGPRVAKKRTYWCRACQAMAQGWRDGKCRRCRGPLVTVDRGETFPEAETPTGGAAP